MKQVILIFGLMALLLLLLASVTQYSLVLPGWPSDVAIAIFAIVLIGIGYVLRRNASTSVLQHVDTEPHPDLAARHGISQRELDVLRLMADGLSNQQIGQQLFISETTVKTHVSNLFVKLDAQRRTEAVSKARVLGVIS